MNPVASQSECRCVGAAYAQDPTVCLNCTMQSAVRSRVRQLERSVDEIYREKLAETLASIRSRQNLNSCEKKEITRVMGMLDEMRKLSPEFFKCFVGTRMWAYRIIDIHNEARRQFGEVANLTEEECRQIELHNLLTTKMSARLIFCIRNDDEMKSCLSEISRNQSALIAPPRDGPTAADDDDDDDDEPPFGWVPDPDCCKGGKCLRHRRRHTGPVPELRGHFVIYDADTNAPRIELWTSKEEAHVRPDAKRADIATLLQHLRNEEEVRLTRLENVAEAVARRRVAECGEAEMQRVKREWHTKMTRLIKEKSESDKACLEAERALERKESEFEALRAAYQDMEMNLREKDADRLDFGISALEQKESEIEALRVNNQDADLKLQRMEQALDSLRIEKDAEIARLRRLMDETEEKMQSQLRRSEAENVQLRTEYKEPVDEILTQQLKEMNRKNKIIEERHRMEVEALVRTKCEMLNNSNQEMNKLRTVIKALSRRRKR